VVKELEVVLVVGVSEQLADTTISGFDAVLLDWAPDVVEVTTFKALDITLSGQPSHDETVT